MYYIPMLLEELKRMNVDLSRVWRKEERGHLSFRSAPIKHCSSSEDFRPRHPFKNVEVWGTIAPLPLEFSTNIHRAHRHET